jgi:hypothetical protein
VLLEEMRVLDDKINLQNDEEKQYGDDSFLVHFSSITYLFLFY